MDSLDEFAQLKREFDNKRSLKSVQLFTIAVASLFLIFFLGSASLFLGGLVFGTIFASVVSTIVILGAVENMRNRNINDFLETRKFESGEANEEVSRKNIANDSLQPD